MSAKPYVLTPDIYPAPLSVVGVDVTVLASAATTGSYEVTMQVGNTGSGPPLHSHPWDECFFVVKGEVDFSFTDRSVKAVFKKTELLDIQELVRDMPVGEAVVDAILTIVRRGRPDDDAPELVNQYVQWAPGPRASQALMLACRAKALLEGRSAPSTADVIALAEPVLKHRMALNYQARADGITLKDVIGALTDGI